MEKPNRSRSSDSATTTRRKPSGGKRATTGREPITRILKTKLRPPKMLPGLVARSRLTDLLQQNPRRPLTLVSAAAGYGKTTVVTQWLHAVKTQPAWLQLDEGDNDLRSFLSHLVSAIQMQIPNACPDTMSLLQAAQIPNSIVLADALNNELDAIEEPFILVLDDYHLIAETTIHELLENLLRHPPRSLHLVLVTRHDPPLSLAGLRARGWLTEIRQEVLRFSRAEVKAVLKEIAGITLSDRGAGAPGIRAGRVDRRSVPGRAVVARSGRA